MGAKQFIKASLQAGAALAGRHRWPGSGRHLVVLMYHRILPADDPRYALEQPGMVVTPETFARHLEWIRRHFNPVHLADWVSGRFTPGKRPACAISFDDGWRDNYEHAYPLLQRADLPATIFLVADFIGTNRDFWPGRVQRLLAHGLDAASGSEDAAWLTGLMPGNGEGADVRERADRAIEALKTLPDGEIEARLSRLEAAAGLDTADQSPVMLDWEQVGAMAGDGLVQMGSHTRNHRRLDTDLPPEELESEIVGSARVIQERTGTAPTLFCYPNGDRNAEAERLVRSTYRGACLVSRGWNRPGTDPFALNRIGMHEDVSRSRIAFLSRANGAL
ncbi:MAG: polysaccharide deacetylase family protein [Ectothiorhodospiraceae bacterium]|nr:polysaccharide deacetylase family protein [Ectothiorhodospiraceae bacterium]